MKKSILYLTAALCCILTACDAIQNRNYTYVERVQERDLFGGTSIKEKNEKIITAPSDSDAYIEAFKNFCISKKVNTDMRKKGMGEYLDKPLDFRLYDDKGKDISNMTFSTKEQKEEEIIARFAAMGNVIDNDEHNTKSERQESRIDSAKIKELLPYFSVKRDEFDPQGRTWYKPKSAPKYTNRNGIYLYFAEKEGKVEPLRFRIQYHSSEWLFFKKVQFSIDRTAYEYVPMSTETDNGSGKIWEWFDERLTGSDRNLIYALADADTAKMKFIGHQYYDIRTISKKQIEDIKKTLELYTAMGGTY